MLVYQRVDRCISELATRKYKKLGANISPSFLLHTWMSLSSNSRFLLSLQFPPSAHGKNCVALPFGSKDTGLHRSPGAGLRVVCIPGYPIDGWFMVNISHLCSMVLEDLSTFMILFWGVNVGKYSSTMEESCSNGWFGGTPVLGNHQLTWLLFWGGVGRIGNSMTKKGEFPPSPTWLDSIVGKGSRWG